MKSNFTINVMLLLLFLFVNSCDFFEPYDAELVDISTDGIDFGLFENEKQFVISYKDSVDVSWEIDSSPDWCKITPESGIITLNDPDTLNIKIDRSRFNRDGNTSKDIVINFQNQSNSKVIPVKLEMKAELAISKKNFTFGFADSLDNFKISNEGNFQAKWNIISRYNWISFEPDSGTLEIDSSKVMSKLAKVGQINESNDTTITMKLNNSNLSVGENKGIIEIKVSGKLQTDTITVVANKASAPLLDIPIEELDFGDDLTSQKFILNNKGEETLNWTATSNAAWISLSPSSGSTELNSDNASKNNSLKKTLSAEIEVKVDRSNLDPGDYNSSIEIRSNGGNKTIPVRMFIQAEPILAVNPEALDFGSNETIQRVQISNSGTGVLHWAVSTSDSWINLVPLADSISTGNQDLNVSVMRLGLLPGDYTGSITVNSDGGTKTIQVKMNVTEFPELSFAPQSLSFSADKLESSFEITNSGAGELTWQLSADVSWIQLSPESGNTTNESDIITVTANPSGLGAGEYSGRIQISSNFGDGAIQVSLTIKPEENPILAYSPTSLDFGESETTKTFEIKNDGNARLNWQLSKNEQWISLPVSSGNVQPNQKDQITVNIDRSSLNAGSYSGAISITSDGGNGNVQILMSVSDAPPVLAVSSSNFNFGDIDSTDSFEISNEGGGELSWDITTDQDWIEVDTKSGKTQSKQRKEIKVKIKRGGLGAGNHSGNIFISSDGGDKSIKVNMSIRSAPKLSVNPSKFTFGEDDSTDSFEIRNTGNGILEWELSTDVGWLRLSSSKGTTEEKGSSEIEINIDRSGLASGDYAGSIIISSNGGEETISVNLTVNELPELLIRQTKITIGDTDTSSVFEISNNGKGTLKWELSTENSWIDLRTASGNTNAGESTEVEFYIDRTGLEPGAYEGTISVASNGGSETIDVSLRVTDKPRIVVSENKLDFGSDVSEMTASISNAGSGTLEWKFDDTDAESWISVSPASGSVTTTEEIISIKVDRSGVAPGSYRTSISILSNGGNKSIQITMEVLENPDLTVSDYEIDFGNVSTSAAFTIDNEGTGTLTWESEIMYITNPEESPSWLQMTPVSGEITSSSQEVKLTVLRSDLLTGSHTADIQIYSNGGHATIHLYMNVVDSTPNAEVSTTILDFGETETEKSFNITNTGGGQLIWELSKDASWITASPLSGETTTETDQVAVKVDRNAAVGALAKHKIRKVNTNSYSGNITVSSNAETKVIQVKMTIPADPNISVSHTSIDFGESIETVTLQIKNVGGGTLNWDLIIDALWIHNDAANGTTTTETDEINLTALRSGRNPGVYEGTLKVEWDSGTVVIPLTMTVPAVVN